MARTAIATLGARRAAGAVRRLARLGWVPWLILAVALAVRVGVVLATRGFEPVADPADYERYARSLAGGEGFPDSTAPAGGPTAYRPPLYPLFLSLPYLAGGPDGLMVARLVQAFLGTVTVALIGVVAAQLWGRRPALAAMAIAAVYPPLLVIGASLLTEPLLVPLELAAVATALQARRDPGRARWPLAAGGLAGLAALTRPNAILLLLPLAAGLWATGGFARRAAAPAAAVLVAVAVIAPWTVRNLVEMDRLIPVSTQTGFTLAGTYNDTARLDHERPAEWIEWFRDERYARYARPDSGLAEAELGERLRQGAFDYALEHPTYVLEVAFWNGARMLHLTGLDDARRDAGAIGIDEPLGEAGVVGFWLVAALALAGAATAAARRAPRWLWAIPLVMASTVLVIGYVRFRAPIDPFLIMLAGLFLASLRPRRRDSGRPAPDGPSVR